MEKYRKLPIIIEAIQYINHNDIPDDCKHYFIGDQLYIKTLEGNLRCNQTDYIIKGIKGEYYPCNQTIFNETYEKVE